jgi:hypothetical protein
MLRDVVVRVEVRSGRASTGPILCDTCRTPLDLHQPNPDKPAEILGICQDCGEWHFVHAADNERSLVVARLPLHDLSTDSAELKASGRGAEVRRHHAASYTLGL